jgi:hypothetical protein
VADVGFGKGGDERPQQTHAAHPVGEAATGDHDLRHFPPPGPRTRGMATNLDRGADLEHRTDLAPSLLRLGDGTLTFE